MLRFFAIARKTLLMTLEHDVLNTAKAAAYSGMLCFFPALLVLTALLARTPEGPTLVGEIRSSFDDLLPPGAVVLLQTSMTHRVSSYKLIFSATSLTIFAGLGLMLSLMEGFRRAYRLPRDSWAFWQKWLRALLLVPLVLVPLVLASLLLVFGHQIEVWMVERATHELRPVVLVFWRLVRWTLAVLTGVAVLAALYHFGTRRQERWPWVLPGAVAAAVLWFPATLVFGWYVTRVADYTRFYGPFAAGIAILVWLYLTWFSAVLGAELNGVLFQERLDRGASLEGGRWR